LSNRPRAYRLPGRRSVYIREPPYKPRRVLETCSIEWLAPYLEQLLTWRDVWRAALLGTLTGAAVVIAWIEVVHRASL
jgi:hypothetical protein